MPKPEIAENIECDIGDAGNLPAHVAIIMDGNGRWAKQRMMPRIFGHNAGIDSLRNIVEAAIDKKISTLSVYAFSTENWRRPKDEIDGLFNLLKQFIKNDLDKLHKNGVRVCIQGRREGLSEDIINLLDDAINKTQNNNKLTLVICFNYGGQTEILDAINAITISVEKGEIKAGSINQKIFEKYLNDGDWPDPDLIIRTAGEQRLSNFLMWQSAYSEFVFSDKLWPDFEPKDFAAAITEYKKRKRRFGGI